jgi:hypothetical protein
MNASCTVCGMSLGVHQKYTRQNELFNVHCISRKPEIAKKWKQQFPKIVFPEVSYFCSFHFLPTDYQYNLHGGKLRKGAIPKPAEVINEYRKKHSTNEGVRRDPIVREPPREKIVIHPPVQDSKSDHGLKNVSYIVNYWTVFNFGHF